MLDFGSAVLLASLLFMLVQLVKKAAGETAEGVPRLSGWAVIVVTIVLALIVVFVTRASDFAGKQIVDGKALDTLNIFSCVIVALFLAGLSVFGATALGVAKSIGQNNDKPL